MTRIRGMAITSSVARAAVLLLILSFSLNIAVAAQTGMRSIQPITGVEDGGAIIPVPLAAVEEFIHALAEAWNNQQLAPLLAPDFPGRNRVLAGFPGQVQPGTQLRILSVGPVRTLEQERAGKRLISVVLARVRAQLEVPGQDGGFRQQVTTQELLIRVVREPPP